MLSCAAYLIRIVHCHGHTPAFKVIDVESGRSATICWGIHQLQLSRSWREEIRGTVLSTAGSVELQLHMGWIHLVTEGMPTDNDRFSPAWDGPRNPV